MVYLLVITGSVIYKTSNNTMNNNNEEGIDGEMHDLTLGDVCTVTKGKFVGKTVLVIKAGLQTKFGLRTITVEHLDVGEAGEEKIWVSPEELSWTGGQDLPTAERIKEADFQEWKARKNAGVPPKSSFAKKPWDGKKKWSGANRPTDTGF